MKKTLLAVLVLCSGLLFGQASPYVTVTGTIQGPNGLPAANDTISMTPTQTFVVPSSGNYCGYDYFLQINTSPLTPCDTVNFNGTTPAAPANGHNILWQFSRSGTTDSVSAAIVGDGNASHFLNGQGQFATASGGGGTTLQTNSVNNASQTLLNLANNAVPGGVNFSNPSGGLVNAVIGSVIGTDTGMLSAVNGGGSTGSLWCTDSAGGATNNPSTCPTGSNATSLQGVPLSATAPATGQFLGYNGTSWIPSAVSYSGGATFTTNVLAPSFDYIPSVDGNIYTSTQDIYAALPSYRGQINYPVPFGSTVSGVYGLAMPTNPFLAENVFATPLAVPTSAAVLTGGACTYAFKMPSSATDLYYYIEYYNSNNGYLNSPVGHVSLPGGNQCLYMGGGVPQPPAATSWSIFAIACSSCSSNAASGATIQASVISGNPTSSTVFNTAIGGMEYTTSASTLSGVVTAQQGLPSNAGLFTTGIDLRATSGATYVTSVPVVPSAASHWIGTGQSPGTITEWAPNSAFGVPTPENPVGTLVSGGSGTAGQQVAVKTAYILNGNIISESGEVVFPPFDSTCPGSGNCQIQLVNPSPPNLRALWTANTQYWVGSVMGGTVNPNQYDIWELTTLGTGISDTSALPQCTAVNQTYTDSNSNVFTCLSSFAVLESTTASVAGGLTGVASANGHVGADFIYQCITGCSNGGFNTTGESPVIGATNTNGLGVTWQNISTQGVLGSATYAAGAKFNTYNQMALPGIGFDFLVREGSIANPTQKYPTGALLRANSSPLIPWTQCSPNAADGNGNICGTTSPGPQYTNVSTTGTGTTDPVVTLTAGACPTGYLSTYGSGSHTVYVRYAWGSVNGYTPPFGETSVTFTGALCVFGTAPANAPPEGVTYALYDGLTSMQENLHPFDGVTLIAGSGSTLGSLGNYLSGVPQGGALPAAASAFVLTGPNPAGATQPFNINVSDCMTALGTPLISPILALGQGYSTTIENMGLESGRSLNQEETQGCSGANIASGEHSGYFNISNCDATAVGFVFQGPGAQNSRTAGLKACGFNRPGRVGMLFDNCISCRGSKDDTLSGANLGTQWFDLAGAEVEQFPWLPGRPQAISITDSYAETANSTLLCVNAPCIGASLNTATAVGRRALNVASLDWDAYGANLSGLAATTAGVCGVHDLVWDQDNACSTSSDGTLTNADGTVSSYITGNLGGGTTAPYSGITMSRQSSDPNIVWNIANGFAATGSRFNSLTDGATVTWAIGSNQIANADLVFTTHGGSRTLNITGPFSGGSYTLGLKQDSTGGEGLILGSGCTWKVANGGAGAITLSSGPNAIDILTFTYDANSSSCYATLSKNFN